MSVDGLCSLNGEAAASRRTFIRAYPTPWTLAGRRGNERVMRVMWATVERVADVVLLFMRPITFSHRLNRAHGGAVCPA
jgi:hypothetical protein